MAIASLSRTNTAPAKGETSCPSLDPLRNTLGFSRGCQPAQVHQITLSPRPGVDWLSGSPAARAAGSKSRANREFPWTPRPGVPRAGHGCQYRRRHGHGALDNETQWDSGAGNPRPPGLRRSRDRGRPPNRGGIGAAEGSPQGDGWQDGARRPLRPGGPPWGFPFVQDAGSTRQAPRTDMATGKLWKTDLPSL